MWENNSTFNEINFPEIRTGSKRKLSCKAKENKWSYKKQMLSDI